jgi:hypothetical protein
VPVLIPSSSQETYILDLSIKVSTRRTVCVSWRHCVSDGVFESAYLGPSRAFSHAIISASGSCENSLAGGDTESFALSVNAGVSRGLDLSVKVGVTRMFSVSIPFSLSLQSSASACFWDHSF